LGGLTPFLPLRVDGRPLRLILRWLRVEGTLQGALLFSKVKSLKEHFRTWEQGVGRQVTGRRSEVGEVRFNHACSASTVAHPPLLARGVTGPL